ncbi:MAG: ABC transporter ATP-binding protein [Chloroflexi bacterium]|nr:ABC transporter ATP-binding protein [Chloroflexota bacterium]
MSKRERIASDRLVLMPGDLPSEVIHQLRERGSSSELVRLLVQSDLAPDGTFGEQWLIIDHHDLWVLNRTPENEVRVRYRFALDDITAAKVERCVGNGLIEITVGEQPHVLLHYSNELTNRFGRVAHYLQTRAEDGPNTPIPDPDADSHRCLTCNRLLVDTSSKVCPNCVQRGRIFRRLMEIARPYWGGMVLVFMFLAAGVLLDLIPPYLTRLLIDDALGGNGNAQMLLYVVLALLGVRILRVLVTIGSSLSTINVSSRFTSYIRDQLFSHIKNLPIEYFDKNQIGRLMTRINTDTSELQGLVSQITTFILDLLLVIGIGVVLFSMSPSLGLYVLIPTPFVIVAAYFYYRYMRPYFERVWIARWRLNAMLNTFLSGVRVVKAFAQEGLENERYRSRNGQVLKSQLQVDLAWSKFFPFLSFAFSAGGLIIWYAGGRSVLEGKISLGMLMAFLNYLGMFYGPLSNLTNVSQTMNRFMTISQRTFEMLDEEPQPEVDHPVAKPSLVGRIEFDHVTFGYDPYYPVLKDLSFKIEPGEMIGVVGHSGAGKTTLINMLCRFYDVNSGAIRIDGVDIRQLSMDEIRKQIGLVLQQPFLFRGTIAENIAYGQPDASREEILVAAKAANAHGFITMLPEGYDTIVGEGGTGLSGGELQRVSIARAILHNPRILILDEATSSVDTETERQIQEALDSLVKGRTTIAIAHRLSTLYNADRIMVLSHGKLEEQGKPMELMESKGAFYNLVQLQTQFASLERAAAL